MRDIKEDRCERSERENYFASLLISRTFLANQQTYNRKLYI